MSGLSRNLKENISEILAIVIIPTINTISYIPNTYTIMVIATIRSNSKELFRVVDDTFTQDYIVALKISFSPHKAMIPCTRNLLCVFPDIHLEYI